MSVRLLDEKFSLGLEVLRSLFTNSGFTVELGNAIRAKDGADRAIKALNQEFFPVVTPTPVPTPAPIVPITTLIHSVFTSTADIMSNTAKRFALKGIDMAKFAWVGNKEAQDFTADPEVAVMLDITLGTLEETFDFAWEWTKDGQTSNYRYDGLLSNPKKLRLLAGSPDFVPYTLQWRKVKLNTDIGSKPMDMRSIVNSPGVAALFAAAQHPARVRATNYSTRFGWWLPGLECTVPDGAVWRFVPYVLFFRDDARVQLFTDWCGGACDYLGVPVFVE